MRRWTTGSEVFWSEAERCGGHEGKTGRALYGALRSQAKAGLLNIAKKSRAPQFKNGADLLPQTTLLEIRGDRCFVMVPPALKEQMPQ